MSVVGAVFQPSFPPERLREAVTTAEEAGVDELWLWEDCFRESGIATAAAALAWTSRISVGVGVLPMPLRNVALTAMEATTLARLFPGRFVLGVGHGVQSWMGQVGARPASPLGLMREYVPALQALLAGERVDADGRYVHLEGVELEWPPTLPVPVLAAGEGERTLRLTGEVADGTVLTAGTSPDGVRRACELIGEGMRAADRYGEPHRVVVYLLAAFGADARERVTAEQDGWRFDESRRVAGAGTPADVAAVASRYLEAGADAVVLQPVADEEDLAAFSAGCGEVATLLR
ncbi:LLM class flavin-dependent oxidoreductase [Agromyces archimandritae]|uniref:LLM class flavin-dependent oxidoreductase n=1 Tax=Agromyces archimandritae TaxID=2781962 RepID=A0A975FKM2_9MICO|nr:LLM class flavin-dependent oxidoreductase [Agromyces archimandritae]QTX03596.1 LLM class flavin-dependent oxidoreductase [Agromyces archimandritae]